MPLFLHLGYTKAASTTLLHNLFLRHPQLAYLDLLSSDRRIAELMHQVRTCQLHRVGREDLAYARERIRDCMEQDLRVHVTSQIAVSRHDRANARWLAGTLHELFGEARIIFVIREQVDLLKSFYFWAIGTDKINVSIDDFMRMLWQDPFHGMAGSLDYHQQVSLYAREFGRDRVSVFLYERIREDYAGFLGEICGTMGIDPGRLPQGEGRERHMARMSHLYYLRKRYGLLPGLQFSRYLPPSLARSVRRITGRRAEVAVPAAWRTGIRDFYRESNRALAGEWGLPLERFGYAT